MNGADERTLALRAAILPGEALDSWLEALARRNGVPLGRLLPTLGIPTDAHPDRRTLIGGTDPALLRRIERQAGLATGRLDQATLSRYSTIGWSVLPGSRYCPSCLNHNGGRWLLRWRLCWVFACTHHQLLLPDRCPGCQQLPRHHLPTRAGLHRPGTCPNPIGAGRLCGTDLSLAPARPLPTLPGAKQDQAWIDAHLQLLEAGATEQVRALADLHLLADWIAAHAGHDDYARFGPEAMHALTDARTKRAAHQPIAHKFTDPLLTGSTVNLALGLLTEQDRHLLAAQLRRLLTRPTPAGATRPAPALSRRRRWLGLALTQRWSALSPGQQARMLHALDPQLAPTDRLRYRSTATLARMPHDSAADLGRSRHVPQLLWAPWTVRMLPTSGFDPDALRAALSTLVLLPGRSERALTTIAAELHPHQRALATNTLRRLLDLGYPDVLVALTRLADYLDQHGARIDYQRRRALIDENLLSTTQWLQLCRDAVAHPGQQRRYLDARRYLFTLLTGANLNDPCHPLAFQDPADRTKQINFATTLSSQLRTALHRHAADHLHRLKIEEPLTWAPPTDICTDLHLPGRDPDDIDADLVHALVIERGMGPAAAARHLATSIEHIRLVLANAPRPRPADAAATPPGWRREQQASILLTKEFFEREYLTAGKRLRDIQAETGFCRTTLARYAKNAGIPLIDPNAYHHIDRAWLIDQYTNQHRSFPQIAAELGMTETTVAAAARRNGIVPRAPGVASHPDLITKLDPAIAPDIRSAVEGQLRGWQRLRRFQQVMGYPSLTSAGKDIDVHPGTLVHQLHRLERDVGGQLLHRATSATPMRPTDRGAALLRELCKPGIRALLERHGMPPTRKTTKR